METDYQFPQSFPGRPWAVVVNCYSCENNHIKPYQTRAVFTGFTVSSRVEFIDHISGSSKSGHIKQWLLCLIKGYCGCHIKLE